MSYDTWKAHDGNPWVHDETDPGCPHCGARQDEQCKLEGTINDTPDDALPCAGGEIWPEHSQFGAGA